jgi:hypothetical protein
MKITKKQKKKFQINLDIDIKYHSSDEDNYINDNIIKTDGDNYDIEEALSEEENTSKQKQHKPNLKLYEMMFNSTVEYIWYVVNGTETYTSYSVYSSNVLNIDIETLTLIGTSEHDLSFLTKDLRKMHNKTLKLGKNFEIEKLSYYFYKFIG